MIRISRLFRFVKRLLLRLEARIRIRPIFLFEISVPLTHLSFSSLEALLIFASFTLSNLIISMVMLSIEGYYKLQVDFFLRQYQDSTFNEVTPAEAVGLELAQMVALEGIGGRHTRHWQFLDWLVLGIDSVRAFGDKMRIFVIKPKTDSSPRLASPTAHFVRSGAFIFLRDHPGEMRGMSRFFLYHELGHISLETDVPRTRALVGATPYFFLLMWIVMALRIEISFISVTALACLFVLCVWMTRNYWPVALKIADMHHEITADGFAFETLDRDDIKRFARFCRKRPNVALPIDSNLDPLFDKGRRDTLRENLEIALDPACRQFVHPQVPSTTPIGVWISMALIVVLAANAYPLPGTPSLLDTWRALGICGVMAMNAGLLWLTAWQWLDNRKLDRGIERRLRSAMIGQV